MLKEAEMDFEAQPSASSSSSSLLPSNAQVEMDSQKPTILDKIEDEQVEKKVEVNDSSFIEELAPGMLGKVFKYLGNGNLLNCRLTNRKWSRIAREILRARDDLEVVFNCSENYETGDVSILEKNGKLSLANFLDCFDGSKETPIYTRFRFNGVETLVLNDPTWIKFVSDFGENITCLKLVVEHGEIYDPMEFGEKLRHLLLNQLPNLAEFGLEFSYRYPMAATMLPAPSSIQLFETTTSGEGSTATSLPHLKVLHLDESFFGEYAGISRDLLGASVNLKKIVPFEFDSYSRYDKIETFRFLQSEGKLVCLEDASIRLDEVLLSKLREKTFVPLDFKVKTLELQNTKFENPSDRLNASQFLSNLFESSKDTLAELKMDILGYLPDLQLPEFSKLTNLSVSQLSDDKIKAFPSGTNVVETFPVLQSLDLKVPWIEFFPHDQAVSCIPNLKSLVILADGMTEKVINQISLVCPNLKEFAINGSNSGSLKNFPQVGTAIWTRMKKLESLDITIDLDTKDNNFPAIDSCITGFSEGYCEHLFSLIKSEDGESAEKQGSHLNNPQSELDSDLEAERQNPSIMDLKGLEKLTVRLLSINWEDEPISGSALSMKGLSVSENYALKLMDNLNYKIEKQQRNVVSSGYFPEDSDDSGS